MLQEDLCNVVIILVDNDPIVLWIYIVFNNTTMLCFEGHILLGHRLLIKLLLQIETCIQWWTRAFICVRFLVIGKFSVKTCLVVSFRSRLIRFYLFIYFYPRIDLDGVKGPYLLILKSDEGKCDGVRKLIQRTTALHFMKILCFQFQC